MVKNSRVQVLKIAFLLMVHNDSAQINRFLKQVLLYDGSYVYIHVDEKGKHIIPQIIIHERVFILKEYINGKWGDYTQIQMVNTLLECAMKEDYDYYSLHSGCDLLIRPIDDLVRFLKKDAKYGYYSCSQLPSKWQYGGGLGRIALKWPAVFRRAYKQNSIMRYIRSLYGKMYGAGIIKGRRLPKEYKYYGGDAWFTISGQCAMDYMDFINRNKKFNELFYDALCGDEIYYVSVFQMCKKNRLTDDKNSLRFIDWKERGQQLGAGSPNVCDMTFIDEIEQSNAFFARKFNSKHDSKIIEYFMEKTCSGHSYECAN